MAVSRKVHILIKKYAYDNRLTMVEAVNKLFKIAFNEIEKENISQVRERKLPNDRK